MTYWADVIGKKNEKAHGGWLERGRQGDGRIDLTGVDLESYRLAGVDWTAARFVKVRFAGGEISMSDLNEAELEDCVFERATFASCRFERARMRSCRGVNATWTLSKLLDADVSGCDFGGNVFARTSFNKSRVEKTRFAGARLGDARLDDATFTDCDFSGADLAKVYKLLDICSAVRTRFVRCDLRNTRWEGRVLAGTVFEDCHVAGLTGRPTLQGPVTILRPDFAPTGDGSDVRGPDALLSGWR